MSVRSLMKKVFRRLGYELTPRSRLGVDAYLDIRKLCGTDAPVAFDVGANTGQTIRKLRRLLPAATIHAFEPAPRAFARMKDACGQLDRVHLVNMGLGREAGELELLEQDDSRLSSYLEPGSDNWGSVAETTVTPVTRLDDYCAQHGVERIDVLKIDTQGFELEVLAGAERLLAAGAIRLVYLELNCGDMYRTAPPLDEVLRFMREHDFALVSLYRFYHDERTAKWTDGLFIRRD